MMLSNAEEIVTTASIEDFDHIAAETVVQWALEKFSPGIALACSFQAEESVLIDMMHQQRGTDFRIFTLDTGRLNQETYDCMDAIRERYGISVEVYFPDPLEVEEMVRARGVNLFYNSVEERLLCCAVRKVAPLKRALKDLRAWTTGLRREQSANRIAVRKVELDKEHGGIVKINPLADWSSEQVWQYIRERNLPFNWLHTQGYASIGCAPCTRAVKPGEDSRAGRWWWENSEKKECGLHVGNDDSISERS
jgi:thioredoxin-dependent adenylylsulfate APS reductase